MLTPLVILGATGNVGRELVRQLVTYDRDRVRIVGLVNSRGAIVDPSGIIDPVAFTDRDVFNTKAAPHEGDLTHLIGESFSNETAIVDVTADAGDTMIALHRDLLARGHTVITANKNPLARADTATARQLLTNERYGCETCVMAGSGAITHLRDAATIGEEIRSVEGCFSGTLGYITSELERGRLFSEIVREARDLGYTEPHPWDDLNGLDVARKLVILARTAGFSVDLTDIAVTPLIPAAYGAITNVDEFLDAIRAEDDAIAARVSGASDRAETLRYVASLVVEDDTPRLTVGLQEVAKASQLGSLSGTSNLVKIVGSLRSSADRPHVIISPGAGLEKTAASVRADLLRMLPASEHQK